MSDVISQKGLLEAIEDALGGPPDPRPRSTPSHNIEPRVTGPAPPVDIPPQRLGRQGLPPIQPEPYQRDSNEGMSNIQFDIVASPDQRDVHVMDLQDWLNKLGMQIEVDGYFTPATLEALNSVTGGSFRQGETIGSDILNQIADMAANG